MQFIAQQVHSDSLKPCGSFSSKVCCLFLVGLVSGKKTAAGKSVTPANDSEAPTLSLKACTLAGMASKTTSTTVQKRIAHVPSLQVKEMWCLFLQLHFWLFPIESAVLNCCCSKLSSQRSGVLIRMIKWVSLFLWFSSIALYKKLNTWGAWKDRNT